MHVMPNNRVRSLREQRAIPQGRLAAAVGLSRQALTSIEAGRASPSVDVAMRIAGELSCSVEDAFGAAGNADDVEHVNAEVHARLDKGAPVLVAWLANRWVAHDVRADTLSRSVDGVAAGSKRIALHRPKAELVDAVFIAGCAPALGALAERAQRRTGTLFRWLSRSSSEALELLRDDSVHVGGVHLQSNETAMKQALPRRGASLVTLASWEVGLATTPGKSKLRSMNDLARPKLRIAWREPGSGAHALAQRLLRDARVPVADVARRATELRTHLAVAQAVQVGFVDVGFTIRAAALACGLDFVPLARERFDLVVTAEAQEDRRIKALLDVVSDGGFRRELDASGYDATEAGRRAA
jgi:putative molybdopterin biosynthesis protein